MPQVLTTVALTPIASTMLVALLVNVKVDSLILINQQLVATVLTSTNVQILINVILMPTAQIPSGVIFVLVRLATLVMVKIVKTRMNVP